MHAVVPVMTATVTWPFMGFNPCGAETGMFQDNSINTIAPDALAPCAHQVISNNDIDFAG